MSPVMFFGKDGISKGFTYLSELAQYKVPFGFLGLTIERIHRNIRPELLQYNTIDPKVFAFAHSYGETYIY
jgi:hypothetical protein